MSNGPREAYEELVRRSREWAVLASCASVLGWDEQTYMPPGGASHRGEQMALLAGLGHERATDPRIGELLAAVEGSDLIGAEDAVEAVNVRELRRAYDRQTRLPRALVEELARTTSLAQSEWVSARAASDFARFRPWLEKIIGLKRDQSACLADAPRANGAGAGETRSIYDPLLDEYEPGAECASLSILFEELRRELAPLIASIVEASARRAGDRSGRAQGPSTEGGAADLLQRTYPIDRQRIFGEVVAEAVGFDFQKGRLDVTAHPFCTGIGPGDCRITTRYDEHHFSDAFFGVLHEVGHGLYEQGLDAAHYGTPMGEAVSLGIHESQSRLWENLVGRSRPFWAHWLPLARRMFPSALAGASLDAFHAAVNRVSPSLVRVQADEATYNLHIIIRFDLERDLLTGDLPVGELPSAWKRKYEEALGVAPQNDAEGCLQDIHWSAGLIGYFPTYTLGNLYAAQFHDAARAELGGLDDAFARGDFRGLLDWLRARIHRQGQRYRPAELVERVTGARPGHRALIDGLRRKYGELYGI